MRTLAPRKYDGQPALWIEASFPCQSRWSQSIYRMKLASRSTGVVSVNEEFAIQGQRRNPRHGKGTWKLYYARDRNPTNTRYVIQAPRLKMNLHICKSQHVERNMKLKSATTMSAVAAGTSGPLNLTPISSQRRCSGLPR
jgi:hypothetical protein